MSARRTLALAGRLAKIRDTVADRARAELQRRDAESLAVRDRIDGLADARAEVAMLERPAAGETLDSRSMAAGRWAGVGLERALRIAQSDLVRAEQKSAEARDRVRTLAIEAERASELVTQLSDARRRAAERKEARLLDALATQMAARRESA